MNEENRRTEQKRKTFLSKLSEVENHSRDTDFLVFVDFSLHKGSKVVLH